MQKHEKSLSGNEEHSNYQQFYLKDFGDRNERLIIEKLLLEKEDKSYPRSWFHPI